MLNLESRLLHPDDSPQRGFECARRSSVYFSPLSPISADFSLRSSLLLQTEKDHRVTDYATAGILSKALWLWMDPFLNAGTKQPLEAADVPLLGASDLTLTVYRKLQSKWLQQEESSRSVWRASANAFWPQFVVIGGIIFVKSIVVYVGSLLIQRFHSRNQQELRIRRICVGRSFASVGVLCAHHYYFLSQKLGIVVLTSLLAMVYHKGLRLSSAGRQSHGVGNIVSYMSTDSIYLLHNMWVSPLQLLLAMGVLSCSVGTPAIAGFGVLVIVAASSLLVAQKQQLVKCRYKH